MTADFRKRDALVAQYYARVEQIAKNAAGEDYSHEVASAANQAFLEWVDSPQAQAHGQDDWRRGSTQIRRACRAAVRTEQVYQQQKAAAEVALSAGADLIETDPATLLEIEQEQNARMAIFDERFASLPPREKTALNHREGIETNAKTLEETRQFILRSDSKPVTKERASGLAGKAERRLKDLQAWAKRTFTDELSFPQQQQVIASITRGNPNLRTFEVTAHRDFPLAVARAVGLTPVLQPDRPLTNVALRHLYLKAKNG